MNWVAWIEKIAVVGFIVSFISSTYFNSIYHKKGYIFYGVKSVCR
ncbi:MAG: hypothetical protein K0Q97_1641 [Bacillota bacterium]|jgi:hypothetical protein|nr:hypothetical protein [Bacillota bacterium]